ncbi:MAG: hypothetical protein HQK56_16240 [Deltaproteobacteria bacterium]|nr:hypothetical protein [Deltaproteobacteria bacterium]
MAIKLWISLPDSVHNNFGIQILTDGNGHISEFDKVEEFRTLCSEYYIESQFIEARKHQHPLVSTLGTFYQGGHRTPEWKYFEFLGRKDSAHQDYILNTALLIANKLGLSLEIE